VQASLPLWNKVTSSALALERTLHIICSALGWHHLAWVQLQWEAVVFLDCLDGH
jgi:hypothetical protein